MLKVGDKLTAKLDLLLEQGISTEAREFEVVQLEGKTVKVQNKQGYYIITGVKYLGENFYLTDNINYEILKLIETDNIEFVSFNGVTIDGKVIDIRKS